MMASGINPVGPIAHYRLDETSADDVVADATGLGRTGAYRLTTGSVGLGVAGLKEGTNTAATFAGGGNAAIGTLPALTDFTVSLLLNPASLGDLGNQDFRTVFAKGEGTPVFGLLEGNGELVWFGEADGVADALFLTEGLGLEVGTTYHIAMSYDSAAQTGTIYVDGVEVASSDVEPFEDTREFYIGAFGEGALPFDGTLDDVQVYDLVLDESQIAYLIANPGQPLVPVGDVDTDLDGLTDDAEVSEHNTNPLVADTDEDGLNDGAEITATTDPLNPDSDGDGFLDGFEVTNNDDPLDGAVPNPNDFLLLSYDFEEGSGTSVAAAGSIASNGTIVNPDNGEWRTGSPSTTGPGYLYFGDAGAGAEAMHVTTGSSAVDLGVSGEGATYTMMAWINVDNTSGDHMVFGQAVDAEVLHNGTRSGAYHQGHWGNDTTGGSVVVDEWHHVAYVYSDGVQSIIVDGVRVAGGPAGPLNVEDEIVIGTTRSGDNRDMVGCIDEVRFYSLPLGEGTIAAIAGIGDSDGDGLDDGLERALFGDLSQTGDDDFDEDGLSNSEEIALGTKANLADTDGDGVSDSNELNTEPNSDPLVADGDLDGLNDGEERAAGTSPSNADTDGDGFGDAFEIAQGKDPLVAGDIVLGPNPFGLLAFFEFNSADNETLTFGSHTGKVGRIAGATFSANSGGRSGAAGDYAINGATGQVVVDDASFFNEGAAADTVTVSFWQKLNSTTNSSSFWAISPGSNNG